jgi:alpha-mannosidase
VIAWNPLAQASASWLRIPVSGAAWHVSALREGSPLGTTVPHQLIPLDARTRSLPLLYLNHYGLSKEQDAAAKRRLANNASHTLTFKAALPAVGFATFRVRKALQTSRADAEQAVAEVAPVATDGPLQTVSNGVYSITYSAAAGIQSVKNLATGVSASLNISWGYYVSSVGGATKLPDGREELSTQASGAYIFRPKYQNTLRTAWKQPTLTVVSEGPLVTEIKQTFSEYASHVIRLTQGSPFIEVEWTAGPIPIGEPDKPREKVGKELVMKFESDIQSGRTFYTDSNGREMVKRVRDARGPSYPPLKVNEPVAGNYYPVNSLMSLDDGQRELAVVTDVSMGGSSMADGELELMVHRRCQHDDSRGVQEPLNETMCGCNDIGAAPGKMGAHGREGDGGCWCEGLTIRGSVYLVLDTLVGAHATRRSLIEKLNFPPTVSDGRSGPLVHDGVGWA